MKIDFNRSTLYITARSPFARRVRLAFHEHGIRFEEKVLDLVKNPHLEFYAVNPLKRVPAVKLETGEILIDSNLILQALYEANPESPLIPKKCEEKIVAYRWSGIAAGVCEKLVEYFFEMMRPEATRDQELLDEIHTGIRNVLSELEKHFVSGAQGITSSLSQADLDVATMLDYLSLRYSRDWIRECPQTAKYLERMHARPSLRATEPPPPA